VLDNLDLLLLVSLWAVVAQQLVSEGDLLRLPAVELLIFSELG
jgi:hypothetical protein